ncbi:MAG: phosphate acyltransferase PlsX [Pseudomonadota bacterium]
MGARLTIALDAMGGDHAPRMVVRGMRIACKRFPEVDYIVFGDARQLEPLLDNIPQLKAISVVRHTAEVVGNEIKASVALRAGRRSSMRLAIDAVAEGAAAGVVSAGNTGALMAMAKVVLKMLPGIDRPAIATFFPTRRSESVMLDLGANVVCDADNLVQFAVMGEVFARTVLGLVQPSIGLLNVGSEDMKGHEEVRAAAAMLRASGMPIRFHGFIEGDDIAAGTVDVVVSDGFTGNIAIKTIEGTVRLYADFVRNAFRSSWSARLGYLLARRALYRVRTRTDPRRYNGATFLGLNGIVVKSHGGTDELGFANAIGVAVDMAANRFNDKIREGLARLAATLAPGPADPRAATG